MSNQDAVREADSGWSLNDLALEIVQGKHSPAMTATLIGEWHDRVVERAVETIAKQKQCWVDITNKIDAKWLEQKQRADRAEAEVETWRERSKAHRYRLTLCENKLAKLRADRAEAEVATLTRTVEELREQAICNERDPAHENCRNSEDQLQMQLSVNIDGYNDLRRTVETQRRVLENAKLVRELGRTPMKDDALTITRTVAVDYDRCVVDLYDSVDALDGAE